MFKQGPRALKNLSNDTFAMAVALMAVRCAFIMRIPQVFARLYKLYGIICIHTLRYYRAKELLQCAVSVRGGSGHEREAVHVIRAAVDYGQRIALTS